MNKNDQQFMAQKIRSQYVEKQSGDLDALRALDAKVKRPANVFAVIWGSIGALVLGSGMSLAMTDIAEKLSFVGNPMVTGTVVGIAGIVAVLLTYPIYKGILKSRKKKYSGKILELSDKIMDKQ